MSVVRRAGAAVLAAGVAVVAAVALAPPAAADPVVDLGGTPVPGGAGSTEKADPTALTAGLWSDTLSPSGDGGATRHYSYDRTMAGSTVWVGVASAGDVGAESSDGADVEVLAGDDDTSCATAYSPSVTNIEFALVGAGAHAGRDDPAEADSDCNSGATLQIVVTHSSSAETDLPFVLKIVEEAPLGAGAPGDLPSPQESPTFDAPSSGGGDVPDGATSLEDAPLLADGASGEVEVTQGDERLWRVHLDWGQSLSVQADVPKQDADTQAALEDQQVYGDPYVAVGLLSPMRASVGDPAEDGTASDTYADDEAATLTSGVPAVTYLGRDGSTPALPGDYWVTLAVSAADEGDDPVTVPVTLTVSTPTSDRDGATDPPAYAEVVTSPSSGAGPTGYDASTPFLVGDGIFAADPSGNPAPDLAGDSGGANDSRQWWGAGVAVVSLLCCAAGVWRLRSA